MFNVVPKCRSVLVGYVPFAFTMLNLSRENPPMALRGLELVIIGEQVQDQIN